MSPQIQEIIIKHTTIEFQSLTFSFHFKTSDHMNCAIDSRDMMQ